MMISAMWRAGRGARSRFGLMPLAANRASIGTISVLSLLMVISQ
jgi:hypothetical protein